MIAFLRELGPPHEPCGRLLTTRGVVKIERAQKQHGAYAATLREYGARVELLRPLPDQPDGICIEDTAVSLPEVAIIARPAASARAREIEMVAKHVAQYRPMQRIRVGRLVGADVLRIGSMIYVAQSADTDSEGITALTEIVEQFGYEVRPLEVRGGWHLKSACTFIPPDFLLVNPEWMDARAFGELQIIHVNPDEPLAANTLTLSGTTLVSSAFPRTEQRLQAAGIAARKIDISELQKMGAGLTGLSLLLEPRTRPRPASRSAVTVIKTPGAPAPVGYETQAIVHRGFIFVSGQLPINPATGRLVRGSIEAQTEQTLNNLAGVLAPATSSLACVLKMTLYLVDRKLLGRVDAVLARVMAGPPPAREVRLSESLPDGCLLEIGVIATVAEATNPPSPGGRPLHARKA